MKMIVTGATGFIGTALCEELLKNGHEVTALVRPGSKKQEKLAFAEAYPGKFSMKEISLEHLELPEEVNGDVFYHLAWNGSSGAGREDFDIQYSNIRYTAEAVKTAVKCGCRKFVGAGSQAEYGVIRGMAKEEETLPRPFMMYGAAKLAAYHMARLVAKQEDISFVWPRIYSIYGIGENPGTLVNYVLESLKSGMRPELTPCENMWNFMYISDCVRALRLLGEKAETEGVYHVASEDTRPLKEFVMEMKEIISPGTGIKFGSREAPAERTFWLEPEVSRLKEIGFEGKISFREGIRLKSAESKGNFYNKQ